MRASRAHRAFGWLLLTLHPPALVNLRHGEEAPSAEKCLNMPPLPGELVLGHLIVIEEKGNLCIYKIS